MADNLLRELGSGVVALAAKTSDKCLFQVMASSDMAEKQLDAQTLIKAIVPLIEGGGGGNKTSAKAGGKAQGKIAAALQLILQKIQGA
jgi:alanyl-tRNA synthetase